MTSATFAKPIQINDIAPDFTAQTTEGTINFHEWIGNNWCIFFSHPKDYTPVCTTELGEVSRRLPDFQKRGAKVIALSVDALESHNGWINDINETQKTKVSYPIIADSSKEIAQLYGMIHPNVSDTFTVRTVFIIDPNKKVRLTITYPAPVGRNFDEIIRVLDALQLADKFSVATPVNWKQGEDVIISAAIKDPEELKKKFPQGYKEVKPYLRFTPQPK